MSLDATPRPTFAVGIDLTPALRAHATGVARYTTSLVEGLAEVAPPDARVCLCQRLSRSGGRRYRRPAPDGRFRWTLVWGAFAPRGLGIAFGPDGRLFRLPGARPVVMVHDVFALEEDGEGREAWRVKMRRRYRETAERARLILFPSTWSRGRFLHHHPDVAPERTRVVPHGVEDAFCPESARALPALRARIGLDGPYALFVGALVERKNAGVLLDAWSRLPRTAPRLVLAGPDGAAGPSLRSRAKDRDLHGRVRFLGPLDPVDLPPLVAGAVCLLLPSRMEGFGLPALEAQACGTPVLHSGRGALRETTGDAALEFDPSDPDAVAGAFTRLLGDPALRARLREAGLERARSRSWRHSARATIEAWQSVVAAP